MESWREVRPDASVRRIFILDDDLYVDKYDLRDQAAKMYIYRKRQTCKGAGS